MSETETVTESAPNGAVVEKAAEEKRSYDGADIRGARREEAKPKEEKSEETKAKPAGYDPVDFSKATPEQLQERFNYMYRQTKESNKTLTQFKKIAAEQSKQIEELTKGYNGVVGHLTTKSFSDSEDAITSELNAAFERGDNKAYLAAQKKLIDLGVEKKLAAAEKPKAPVQQRSYDAQETSASRLANDAADSGEITPEDAAMTEAWQNEKDENGRLLRPWSKTADMSNPDPEFAAALREAQGVFSNPRLAHLSHQEKLAELDKRMGVAKRVAAQTVSGGGLTGKGKTSKITLTPEIEKLAIRTKFGGPKAKTDADHIEAYRQQLAKVKGKR